MQQAKHGVYNTLMNHQSPDKAKPTPGLPSPSKFSPGKPSPSKPNTGTKPFKLLKSDMCTSDSEDGAACSDGGTSDATLPVRGSDDAAEGSGYERR